MENIEKKAVETVAEAAVENKEVITNVIGKVGSKKVLVIFASAAVTGVAIYGIHKVAGAIKDRKNQSAESVDDVQDILNAAAEALNDCTEDEQETDTEK